MSVQAITSALALRGVSASEKLLLLVLANYADENNQAYPSHRRLAAETGLSDRTILSVLKSLEARGVLSRRERKRADGSRSSDVITLNIGGEMVSPRGEVDGEGVGKSLPQGGEMVSPLTTFEPSLNRKIEPAGEPEGFAEFWEAYPKKVAKGAARKAFKAASKKAKPSVLIAALSAYNFGPETKFLPHPATWLNGEYWLDVADEPAPRRTEDEVDPWAKRLRAYRLNGYWHSDWGAKPGKPGCKAPTEALMSAGYLPPPNDPPALDQAA